MILCIHIHPNTWDGTLDAPIEPTAAASSYHFLAHQKHLVLKVLGAGRGSQLKVDVRMSE